MEEPRKQPHTEHIVTAVCVAALLGIFVLWAVNKPPMAWYEYVIMLSDIALFSLIGFQFISSWFQTWRNREPEPELDTEPIGWKTDLTIFCLILIVHAARFLVAFLWESMAMEFDGTLSDSMWYWKASDSRHYLDIAQHWYSDYDHSGTVWRLVFLPFYPVLVRAAAVLTRDYLASGILVSVICSSAAGSVLYRLARLDYDRETSLRAVKYYVIFPAALFYTAALSEGTFMLLALLCIYLVRKKNWLLACTAGGLAAFTRSVGIILLVPVCFEWLTEVIQSGPESRKKTLLSGFSLLLIPLGFGAYLLINYAETGDWFRFAVYQSENWDQHLGWFFGSVRYQLTYLLDWFMEGRTEDGIGLWAASLLSQFFTLGVMALTARKQRPSYVAYFLIYFMITMGATWLLSAPRYLLVMFPLLLGTADLTRKKWADYTLSAGCLVLGQIYLYAFLNQFDVY